MFNYLPTPEVLHRLARGRLADRLQRSVRLWVLLHQFYGHTDWVHRLPQPFRYRDVRDRLFASTHGRSETASVSTLTAQCDLTCWCQRSLETWLEESTPSISVTSWQQEVIKLTDIAPELLSNLLEQCPFATVHRSIRDDLVYLADMGWLTNEGQGRFRCLALSETPQDWPKLPEQPLTPLGSLSVAQTWEVLRSLESISFVRPDLEVIIQSLWKQLITHPRETITEPEQRIFIHLDYILPETIQEQVDTLQEQVERLWREGGGVVQFDYWLRVAQSAEQPLLRKIPTTVYPVCLHYARRAKYLSAYGYDPANVLGWHNYRLDRIASSRVTPLAWDDPRVPEALATMRRAGRLPVAQEVSTALEEAWGFNFYLPRQLLIIRFPAAFAQWYVNQTHRHPTFQPVTYEELPALVKCEIKDPEAKEKVLQVLAKGASTDVYYRAWIRLGDINIVMRLRDWRPNGEVIAPLELRQQMKREAQAELLHYE